MSTTTDPQPGDLVEYQFVETDENGRPRGFTNVTGEFIKNEDGFNYVRYKTADLPKRLQTFHSWNIMTETREIQHESGPHRIVQVKTPELKVVVYLTGSFFQDEDDFPDYEDDAHILYPALRRGESSEGTNYEELADAMESNQLNPYYHSYFILNRPEPDARARLEAVKAYFS